MKIKIIYLLIFCLYSNIFCLQVKRLRITISPKENFFGRFSIFYKKKEDQKLKKIKKLEDTLPIVSVVKNNQGEKERIFVPKIVKGYKIDYFDSLFNKKNIFYTGLGIFSAYGLKKIYDYYKKNKELKKNKKTKIKLIKDMVFRKPDSVI